MSFNFTDDGNHGTASQIQIWYIRREWLTSRIKRRTGYMNDAGVTVKPANAPYPLWHFLLLQQSHGIAQANRWNRIPVMPVPEE